MTLIDNFTKILKPCTGCGSSFWQSIPIKEGIMQFAVTVIIEAENLKSAILKVPEEVGEVSSAIPRPQQSMGQVASVARSGTSQPVKS